MPRLSLVLGLLLGLLVAEAAADEIPQSGRWVLPPSSVDLSFEAPASAELPTVQVHPAGGGELWYELRFRLAQRTELVLDFASSSTLDHFVHHIIDADNRVVQRIEGGLRFTDRYDYFLRHGRRLTLPAGNYRVLTRLQSPFYLALPEPRLFERRPYERGIPWTQSLTLTGLGIFFGLLFYYALMALWRRSGTDGLYALFILGNLLYNGAALLVYSQLFGWSWFYLISTPILFSNVVYVLFVMRLLAIRRASHPVLYGVGVSVLCLLVGFWPLALLWPNWSLEFCRIGVALFALYGLFSGITRSLQGSKVARFYLVANAAFSVPALIAISLKSTNNPMYLVEHLGMIAVLIEVLLLAQVLSYQIGQIYREQAESRPSLERGKLLDNLTAQAPGVVYQFEMSPAGAFSMPFASRRLMDFLELSPEQARKDTRQLFDRTHPQDYRNLIASIIQSARHLSTWHEEFRAILPEQGLRWLEGTAEPERLPDGTTRWYGFISDITERKQAEEHMRHMAQLDPLTRLPNRALFSDRLTQALKNARRYSENCALLFIDLDGFKVVNDRYGHELGDELLRHASQAMTVGLRAADTVARLGGDEFVVLIDNVSDAEEATTVAGKILRAFQSPFAVDDLNLRVGASIGIALFPQHASDEAGLLRAADQAMYRAKQSGGNCAVLSGMDKPGSIPTPEHLSSLSRN